MDNTQASIIYEQIGQLLWSIMDEDSVKVVYKGVIYETFSEFSYFLHDRDRNEKAIVDLASPKKVILTKIMELMKNLQQVEPFSQQEPFTHFTLTLTEEGKFGADFAYIPREDLWSSLQLKNLNDLTEQEAVDIGALEEWRSLTKKDSKK